MRGTIALLMLGGGVYLVYTNKDSLLPINNFFSSIGNAAGVVGSTISTVAPTTGTKATSDAWNFYQWLSGFGAYK